MIDKKIIVGKNSCNQRDTYFDSLKFILISCVVLGHVLNHAHDSRINLALWNWLYSFEMPLFVFISGYFTKRKTLGETFNGCLRLFETLFIWNILYCLIDPSINFTLYRLFKPAFAYWYLMCLIIWRFLLQILPLDKNNHIAVIALAFIAGLIWGFIDIDGSFMSNSRVIAFFPFFLLGVYAREAGGIERIRSNRKWISYMILGVVFGLILFYNDSLAPYFNCSRSYIQDGGDSVGLMYRLLFYVVSLLQGYALLNIAPNNSFYARLGGQTMPIYVFHGFALLVLMKFVSYLNLPMSVFFILCYSVVVLFSIVLVSKFVNYKMLLNPISAIIKYFDNKKNK